MIGTRLAHYDVVAHLGSGGMGDVYAATDLKLGRRVALKLLPTRVAQDADRLARFQREARVLASLNHPNIAAIHRIEDAGERRFLVMELVEGDTLAERLLRGPLPINEALAIARQIVDALDAAHEKDIVHRDLKPANIKVTPDGTVKVLDFGLAKQTPPETTESSLVSTATAAGTREGVILGTVGYMSPEQARGVAIDKRTDIWAFGCVLYEMLTGRQTFSGGTFSDAIAAILSSEPDWTRLPPKTPDSVRRLLHRCLRKDRAQRLRDIHDAGLDLDETTTPGAASSGAPVTNRALFIAVAIAVVLATAATAVLVSWRDAPGADEELIRFPFMITGSVSSTIPLPSPDGQHLAAIATLADGRRVLWLRAVDDAVGRQVDGTDGVQDLFWFPDGRSIGFYVGGRVRRVSPVGGNPQTIVDVPDVFDMTANAAGDLVFAPSNRSGLFRVRQGGKPQPLTTLDTSLTENSHRHPHFLPDGDRFLFTARAGSAENNALYLGSLSTGTTRRLRNVESQAVYVGGHDGFPSALLYVREGTLFRHPFDGTQFTADPIPIADVEHGTIGVTASFAASRDGTVLVTRTGDVPTVPTWFTRDGAPDGVLPPGDYLGLRISPDGARGVFNRPDGKYGNRDTWLIDLKSFALQRLTNHPANDLEAVWSPDGRRVAFSTDRDGGPALRVYVKGATDVTAPEQPIPNFPQGDFDLMDWSSDGRWLGLHGHAAPYNDVMIVPMSGEAAFPLATTPFTEVFPRFSPDGKRVAFSSTVSGRSEIYVRPFTSAGSPGMPATQVSTGGAIFPVWSRTGGELYFLGSDSQLYAVATNSLSTPQSVPRVLFRPCVVAGQGQPYDVGPDGRFLVLCRGEAAAVVVTVGREATSSRLEH